MKWNEEAWSDFQPIALRVIGEYWHYGAKVIADKVIKARKEYEALNDKIAKSNEHVCNKCLERDLEAI